jgi:hypothetical protein
MCANAQEKTRVLEKYVFHKLEVLNSQTKEPIETFDDYKGIVFSAVVNGQEYLSITLVNNMTFNLIIANKAEDIVENNLKIRMYQGGENIEGMGTYTANVLFHYYLSKNANIPESIWFEINGSPYIYNMSGIVKIK